MLTDDQIVAGMGAARDQVLATIRDHEDAHHGGGVCNATRMGILAFFAHSVGFKSGNPVAFGVFIQTLAGYEERCPCCKKGGETE
jgi:hypothetical protein